MMWLHRRLHIEEFHMTVFLQVRKIVPYPKYNGESRRYIGDIAIIVTKELFKWGPVVQPVCISNIDNILLRVGGLGEVNSFKFILVLLYSPIDNKLRNVESIMKTGK